MDRITLESRLNRDRAWLIEAYAAMAPEDLDRGATPSEHDASVMWSPLDHLAHLALIEHNFVAMIRRHIGGDANPVGLMRDASGKERSREEIMAGVHAMTEKWAREHRGKSLADVVAVTQAGRAETLKLISELSDEQLLEKLPGAPWADGTIGGVLGANADHGRMHWKWMKDGFVAQGLTPPEGGA